MLFKLCLAGAVSLVALATAVGSASAYRFTIEPSGNIRLESLGRLTFTEGFTEECTVTLAGSLVAETPFNSGETFGQINSVTFESGCNINRALELPWSIQFYGWFGTPPNELTGILWRIVNSSWFWDGFFYDCLYRGYWEVSVGFIGGNPYTTQLVTSLGNELGFQTGGGACPSSMTIEGTLSLNPEQRIRVV